MKYSDILICRTVSNSPTFKSIDRPFGGGSRREYTHSIPTGKLEGGIFFLSYFKGPFSQDQQKTFRCRLITCKVTLTGTQGPGDTDS